MRTTVLRPPWLPVLVLLALPSGVDSPARAQAPAPAAKSSEQLELERTAEAIRLQVEELRGMKFKRSVAVELTDKQGFLDYARKRQQATETPERRARDESVAKLLGLIPREMDLAATFESFLEQQVGGFYDPGSDTFYLMRDFNGDLARIILAHELTHALDDQHFDLDAAIRSANQETDAEFAVQALAEGSGTNAMNVWTIRHMGELDKQALAGSSDLGTKGLDTAPTLVWKPLLAAYLRGEGFLVHSEGMNVLASAAKTEELRRAFTDPPRSSEQILHPKKYWDAKKRDDPVRVTLETARLPRGWKVLGEDTLGELYLALVTQPFPERGGLDAKNPLSILGVKYTHKAAEGWGGDRLVLAGKDDARVLYLVTVWDTPADAQEFHAALAELTRRDAPAMASDVVGPEELRVGWLAGLGALELVHEAERAAVTLRIEWKTHPDAEGLPRMLEWSAAK